MSWESAIQLKLLVVLVIALAGTFVVLSPVSFAVLAEAHSWNIGYFTECFFCVGCSFQSSRLSPACCLFFSVRISVIINAPVPLVPRQVTRPHPPDHNTRPSPLRPAAPVRLTRVEDSALLQESNAESLGILSGNLCSFCNELPLRFKIPPPQRKSSIWNRSLPPVRQTVVGSDRLFADQRVCRAPAAAFFLFQNSFSDKILNVAQRGVV